MSCDGRTEHRCRAQGFQEAKGWYARAVTGLSIAVREGELWYCGALKSAEASLARVEQDPAGSY
jgi:hypothetical protein